MNLQEAVFISYAWGGPLANKEWLRQKLVSPLELINFAVFWDRDVILYGQTTDEVIEKALNVRPISILCICDKDYVKSALVEESGLYRELKLIANIVDMKDVQFIPVILDEKCVSSLPALFKGRLNLNLTMLHARGLALGSVLADAILGAKQPEIAARIALQLMRADLIERADIFLKVNPFELYGDANTHEILINNGDRLLPPTWMYQTLRWSSRVLENTLESCPKEGIWAWHHGSPSTGMCMLGAAMISAFFPDKSNEEEIVAIEYCGNIIAEKILSFIKETEPLILDGRRIVQHVMRDDGALGKLTRLLA